MIELIDFTIQGIMLKHNTILQLQVYLESPQNRTLLLETSEFYTIHLASKFKNTG